MNAKPSDRSNKQITTSQSGESELIESLKGRFGSYEVPKKFLFIAEPFTVANGLLTQTMKLKRRKIAALYEAKLVALYSR